MLRSPLEANMQWRIGTNHAFIFHRLIPPNLVVPPELAVSAAAAEVLAQIIRWKLLQDSTMI